MCSFYRKRKRDKEDLIPLGSRENSNANSNPNINVLLRVRVCVYVGWKGGGAGENIRAKGLEEIKERPLTL